MINIFKNSRFSAVIIFLSFFCYNNIIADDWVRVVNLEGAWKFNIGNDSEWSKYNFNDSEWENIRVPSSWEDEGYHNYNGYAWYRKHFKIPGNLENGSIYISLGYIDDVDEVYLNGKLVGASGSFPPNYQTAYNANRKYPVPSNFFYPDKENVIAVKVYDSRLAGGIVSGDISIMMQETLRLEKNLEGLWKFKLGDDLVWKTKSFYDSDWDDIAVPSKWEISGYPDYNGFAWYRKSFDLDRSLVGEKLILLLGKIDDIDQCYLNGKLIGTTGDFETTPKNNWFDNEYQELRGYYIPEDALNFGSEHNIIAVRVYDGYLDGGIYQGPIGIATQEDYQNYWKDKKRKKSFWDYLFNR